MPVERNDGVSVNRVVERVKCELGRAIRTEPGLQSWIGNITLILEVNQSGAVMPSASMVGPFGVGTYGLDVSGGFTSRSIQTSLVTIYFPIYELLEFADRCPIASLNQLEDSLGLQQWVERTFPLNVSEGAAFKDKEKAIGYTLEFDLELSAGVTPGFTFVRANGKDGLSASRRTANTLQIALADAGIVPPRTIVERTIVYRPARRSGKPGPDATIIEKKLESPKPTVIKRKVQVGPSQPSADGKRRLDAVIQRLQLNNIRLR